MNKSDSSKPLAILSAPGSRGDVNPMVAMGRELIGAGFDVAFSVAEPYAQVASDAGLTPYCLVDRTQFDQLLNDAAMWKTFRGVRRVLQGVAGSFLQPHFDLIQSIHRPGRTVLVSHPLDFASRIFRDLDPSTPLVDVHLAPVMLRNRDAPPRLTGWRFDPTGYRSTFRLAYWVGDVFVIDPLLAPSINRIRRREGLPAVRRVMHRWWLSPDRILACYPEWFAPQSVGFLPQLRHVGFPLDDGSDEPFDRPLDHPVLFTGGSANWHTRVFFDQAAAACQKLGRSGILLGGNKQCFPADLPDQVRPMGYTPLGKLLPHCDAIVHHGGIGTTSQAIRAGVPQVIRPLAFDQFDNGQRVAAFGAGICLHRDRDLAMTLDHVLNDSSVRESAAALSEKIGSNSGARMAAEEIVAVATDRTRSF